MQMARILLATFLICGCVVAQSYTIHTVAGGGGFPENVNGASASLGVIPSVAVDASGNVYMGLSDSQTVVRLDTAGFLTRVAGNGGEFGHRPGPATEIGIGSPQELAVDSAGNLYIAGDYVLRVSAGSMEAVPGTEAVPIASIALDSAGNLYIADSYNQCIRKVANGVMTVVAGNGTRGYGGDGGPVTNAKLDSPTGVAVDAAGTIYIADKANNRIRRVSNGTITTVAGNGTQGYGGDNGPATSAALNWPTGVAVDAAGNLYIIDALNHRIRRVSNGVITTFAGTGTRGYSGDNGPATSAQLNGPSAIALDASGSLYIADAFNHRLRKVSNGTITTLAGSGTSLGDGGPATSARLNLPIGVALDSAEALYLTDGDRVRRVSNGVISTVAGSDLIFGQLLTGDGIPATSAWTGYPTGIAIDSADNPYFAVDSRVRKVSNGLILTVAGTTGEGSGGDNIPATSADMNPTAVAFDSVDNLYIADRFNDRIRKVSNGVITTVAGNGAQGFSGDGGPAIAAQLNRPSGLAVDAEDNLYIAADGRIRKVSGGLITTVAGGGTALGDNGPATDAILGSYCFACVAVDAAGNLYIADTSNNRIRKVSSGLITTIAGIGIRGFSGDDGPATSAGIDNPFGIAVGRDGKIYFADTANNRIRVLVPSGDSNPPPVSTCTYSLDHTGQAFPAAGGTSAIHITAGPGCPWGTRATDWVTITGAGSIRACLGTFPGCFWGDVVVGGTSGEGYGLVTFSVSANTGAARTTTFSLAGHSFEVNQASVSTPVPVPAISAVTSGAASNVSAIQSNSWVTISGSNLAPAGSGRAWEAWDIVNGKLPTSLDGVSVTINGKPAFVAYISPTQIEVLAPDDSAAGPVSVVVTDQFVPSAAFNVWLQVAAPAFFTLSPPNQRYITAVFLSNPDGSVDLLAPAGAFGSYARSRPAKPGDIVKLYGTGFGPTNPKPPAGQLLSGTFPTAAPVTVTIGGIKADVAFAELTAPGLYQLNVTVPNVPDGDAAVVATVGGVQSQGGAFIPVRH